MAGRERSSAVERRSLSFRAATARRAAAPEAPRGGAAPPVGLEPGTSSRWNDADVAADHAWGVRRSDPPLGRGGHAMPVTLLVNGQKTTVDVDPSTPLLWVLREELGLTGTKYGCGIGACGACTVHLDGVATRSCLVPISLVGDRHAMTIEGVARDPIGRVVQDAWVDKDVVQCGYCQSGQIMRSAAPNAAWSTGPRTRKPRMPSSPAMRHVFRSPRGCD